MPSFEQIKYLALARRLQRDESGASLVEFTVIAPFLFTLGLGVFEFGNVLYQYHLVTGGIRDAGRYAAGMGPRDDIVRTDAKRIAVYGSLTETAETDKRVDWWDIDDIGVRYCILGVQEGDANPACPCNKDLGLRGGTNKVCVSTTVTYNGLGFLSYFGIEPITITTAHEERYFGVR